MITQLRLVTVSNEDVHVSDPWMYLMERHPDVRVRLLPPSHLGTRWGQTLWHGGVPEIHLAFDLGKIQRRCTLAHELHHVIKGEPCAPLCPDDEADVVEQTARFLLPDLDIIAVTLAKHDLEQSAERLGVTRNVLCDRLDSMTEPELVQFNTLMRDLCEQPPAGSAACDYVEIRVPRRRPRRRYHDCAQVLRGRVAS